MEGNAILLFFTVFVNAKKAKKFKEKISIKTYDFCFQILMNYYNYRENKEIN